MTGFVEEDFHLEWTKKRGAAQPFALDEQGCTDWWSPPPWNKKKDRASVLDVERLLRRHRPEIQRLLSDWLKDEEKAA
jgi:hypothetical protein